jgi:hypothetical protein
MRLKFQERSELKLVSRIIPGAKRRGIWDSLKTNEVKFEAQMESIPQAQLDELSRRRRRISQISVASRQRSWQGRGIWVSYP